VKEKEKLYLGAFFEVVYFHKNAMPHRNSKGHRKTAKQVIISRNFGLIFTPNLLGLKYLATVIKLTV